MKGGLWIDEPSGERWALALDLLDEGREFVSFGNVQLARHHGWPNADGKVHVAVLTTNVTPTVTVAQREVDDARERIEAVVQRDPRLRSIVDKYGVVWEYVGDDGSATWLIAPVDDDGRVLWDRP